ncbi:MAG: YceD family protein [Candidatus Binatia bacterium]
MKVLLDQIKASPTPLQYREGAEPLNARLHEGSGTDDFRFPNGLDAELRHYRAGLDVVFDGALRGEAEGTCGRCLETYRFSFEAPLRVVLAPRASAGEGEDDDLGLGFFEGEEIDVTGLVVEHAMLALPTIPVCQDDCRGLCPRCGVNRNLRPCACATETSPYTGGLAALANLKRTDARGGR